MGKDVIWFEHSMIAEDPDVVAAAEAMVALGQLRKDARGDYCVGFAAGDRVRRADGKGPVLVVRRVTDGVEAPVIAHAYTGRNASKDHAYGIDDLVHVGRAPEPAVKTIYCACRVLLKRGQHCGFCGPRLPDWRGLTPAMLTREDGTW